MPKTARDTGTRAPRAPAKKASKKEQRAEGKARSLARLTKNAKAAKERAQREHVARLTELVDTIDRRIVSIREAFYDIGACLKEIRDEKLFLSAEPRTKTFDDFLAARAWFDRSYAFQLIEIATVYERPQALALGTSRAKELLKYAKRTSGDRSRAQALAEAGVIEGRALAELAAEDIRLLGPGKKKKGAGKQAQKDAEREARREARLFDEWLGDHGLPGAVARAADDDGQWLVEVRVPTAVLARFRARRASG